MGRSILLIGIMIMSFGCKETQGQSGADDKLTNDQVITRAEEQRSFLDLDDKVLDNHLIAKLLIKDFLKEKNYSIVETENHLSGVLATENTKSEIVLDSLKNDSSINGYINSKDLSLTVERTNRELSIKGYVGDKNIALDISSRNRKTISVRGVIGQTDIVIDVQLENKSAVINRNIGSSHETIEYKELNNKLMANSSGFANQKEFDNKEQMLSSALKSIFVPLM